MTRSRVLSWAVLAWATGAVALAGCHGSAVEERAKAEPPPPELRRIPIDIGYGETVEQTLAGGECHVLDLELDADRFVEVSVVQRGLDLYTTVASPRDADGVFFDTPTDASGPELAAFLTERAGPHRVEICAWAKAAGAAPYDLRVAPPRPPSEDDRALARGLRRFSQAEASVRAGDLDAAVAGFEDALRHFEAAGSGRPRAWSHFRLGRLETERGRLAPAEEHYVAAANLYGASGDARLEGSALSHVGLSLSNRDELVGAREAYHRFLDAAERAGDSTEILKALGNLARVHEQTGQTLEALELQRRRRALAAEVGAASAEWDALSRMGKVYLAGGDERQAERLFEEALAFARRHGLADAVTDSLMDVGRVHLEREDPERAIGYFLEALEREDASGPDRKLAEILNNVGRCHRRLGEPAKALAVFRRALAAIPSGGWDTAVLEGLVLINVASLHNLEGAHEEAAVPCERAFEVLRAAGRPIYTTGALKCLADVAEARGELDLAASRLAQAVEIVETLRSRSALHELRGSFIGDSYSYYESYVDVLLRLHEREPEAGHAARAFAVAERAKARLLLDNLAEAESDLRSAADPATVARAAELERQMSKLEVLLLEAHPAPGSEEEVVRDLERRLRGLEAEHALVTARIFADHPGWSALLDSEPASLEEIRRDLLPDGETQLVSFLLGEERSFVWILGPDSLHVEVLPARERLDRLARQVARHLRRSDQPHLELQARLVARQLSTELLDPVLDHLTGGRLVLVKDGALHYVPFAALPIRQPRADGGGEPRLMIDRFELVEVPSASAAVALRRRRAPDLRPVEGELAILADPVFQADDERLRRPLPYERVAKRSSGTGSGDLPRTTRALGLGGLERLEGSRVEAWSISRLVPADRRRLALGFAANRDLLLSGELDRYRILHLAGHGLAHPELTGLVLSRYDGAGRPVDGLIRPYEIYGMDLSAELVVLSACSTGLGDEVRGEGLLGLSRGFLYAGASKVLASLWDVDDRATAALMERFYVALLRDGDPPARALRRAQRSLRQEPGWAAPHYWAGFVIQGDGA